MERQSLLPNEYNDPPFPFPLSRCKLRGDLRSLDTHLLFFLVSYSLTQLSLLFVDDEAGECVWLPGLIPLSLSVPLSFFSRLTGTGVDPDQLQHMAESLSVLPLKPVTSSFFPGTDIVFDAGEGLESHALVPLLQALSPLENVFGQIKCVELRVKIGPGVMVAIAELFQCGLLELRCERGFTDPKGLLEAVSQFHSLCHLSVSLEEQVDPIPATIPACIVARIRTSSESLYIGIRAHPDDTVALNQLDAVRDQWLLLESTMNLAGNGVTLSVGSYDE